MRFHIILLLFLIACQPAKKNLNASQEVNPQTLIEKKLGGEYEYLANGQGNHWLCWKLGKTQPRQVDFLVYDVTNQKIIYQERLDNGSVEWETGTMVKITEGIGNRTKNYPEGYRIRYFDIKKERITDKISENN